MRLTNSSQLLSAVLATGAVAGQTAGRNGASNQENTGVSPSTQHLPPRDVSNLGRGAFGRLASMAMPDIGGMNQVNLAFDTHEVAPQLVNSQPAGVAAGTFQEKYQAQALQSPGSVQVTPAQLGFKPEQLVMIDVGGEGQKTDGNLKSGSAHAININAQTTVSSTPINMALEPDGKSSSVHHGATIPNLIRPAAQWPAPGHTGKLLPLADGFSGLTMIEGAPLFPYHVKELGRVTNKQNGWIALAVSDHFDKEVSELAKHHGGEIWKIANPAGAYPLQILPPASKAGREDLKAQFTDASSHDLFNIVEGIRAGR